MLVTFPQMGRLSLAVKALLEGLDVSVAPPPPITQQTIELGVKASRTACLPTKITLGSIIEAAKLGANTIFAYRGNGACRHGYYSEVLRLASRELPNCKIVTVEPNIIDVLQALHEIAPKRSLPSILKAIRLANCKLLAADTIERKVFSVRAQELFPDAADSILSRAITAISAAKTILGIERARDEAILRLSLLECRKEGGIIRIKLIDDSQFVPESINPDILRAIGKMGVEIVPSTVASDYIRMHMLKRPPKTIGREQETKAIDGIIHLLPAECSLPSWKQVSRPTEHPVLSLCFSEQWGKTGLEDKLQGFAGDLRSRKRYEC